MSYNLSVDTSFRQVSGQFAYNITSGDTLYYADTPNVSASNHIGVLEPGDRLDRDADSWIVSAGRTYFNQVARSNSTSAGVVDPPDGASPTYDVGTRRFLMKASPAELNVRDFGAKGDGVTDDTDAIQLALDRAKATGGGVVYLPSGTYRVEGGASGPHENSGLKWALNVSGSNITLRGDGTSTIIKTHSTEYANLRILFIRGSWKLGETDDIQTNRFSDFVPYDMDDATLGSTTLTLTDAEDANNFEAGDWIYVRAGQLTAIPGENEPDAEINRVREVDGADLVLQYPLAKDYTDDSVNPFGVSNVNDYTIENVTIEELSFDHQAGSDTAVTCFDGVVEFNFRPAHSVCSGQLVAVREVKNMTFNVSVHFDGSHAFHWPITLATGCTDCLVERCLASTEQGIVQFHVHEGAARWRAQNVILLNADGQTSNANSSVSISDSYDGVMVAPTIINGGHTSGSIIRVQGDVGYGTILAPTVLGDFGSASPALLETTNWIVRDPHVADGQRIKLNYVTGGNKAPLTPIIQEELTAFVDYTDTDVILGTVPPDSYIRGFRVQVFVAFTAGSTNNLNIGSASNATQFVSGLAVGTTGIKSPSPSSLGWRSTATEIHAAPSLTGTAAGAGRALVTVEYSRSLTQ